MKIPFITDMRERERDLIDRNLTLAIENALLKARAYRGRARRSDASDLIAAKINTTERLRKAVGRG